jgi:pyruvate dehydrogenase E1 component alpha subunit
MEIPKEKLMEMYRNLVTARRLDEKLYEMFSTGASGMPWLHRGTGEEAIPIATCASLRKDDFFMPEYRTTFCGFAKGLTLVDSIAGECFKDLERVGGHSTFFAPEYGLLGVSETLGEDVAIYVGAALSANLRKTDQVSVCIFGDGAANRGPVHEAMAVAAVWKLPIVFIIQNNQYAEGTAVNKAYAINDLSDRAKAYGFPGQTVDGNDIMATYVVVKDYIDRARNGDGPGLVVAETYRLRGHFEGDPQIYRPKGEVEAWRKKDPLPRFQKKLIEMGLISEEDANNIDRKIRAAVDEAGQAALAVPSRSYEDYIKGAIAEL